MRDLNVGELRGPDHLAPAGQRRSATVRPTAATMARLLCGSQGVGSSDSTLDDPMSDRQREAVPQPDPLPSPRSSMLRRFRRIMGLLALLSIVVAAIAVVLVASGEEPVSVHALIATALGAGLTVLLGTALMTLTFLSSSSGHDQQASRRDDESDPT